jgi:carbamoyltransferase
MKILGISAYYHDSAAALIDQGKIIAAAQEERFTRKKHDSSFPRHAIEYCLKEAKVELDEIQAVVFYDKPLIKFERLLETYLSYAPKGLSSFLMAMPIWLKEKLFLKSTLKKELKSLLKDKKSVLPKLLFAEHHQSHAASAYFPSPFEKAAVLCLDGVGEWATTSVWLGNKNKLELQWEIEFPHSLGMLYSSFTYYTGFKVNSGEYKLMGLAPYGEPKYVDVIYEKLISLKEDGTFRLNMDYFNFAVGLTMTNEKFHDLFGGPPRKPEAEVTQKEMDLARSIQVVTEEVILKLARTLHREFKVDALCLAGGVALNCVANGRLLREGPFKHIWIQPAAGDAGGSLGAALSAWHEYYENGREVKGQPGSEKQKDQMQGSYLGPGFDEEEISTTLDRIGARYQRLSTHELNSRLAELLEGENVIGWCQGRMEFGPRALGGRSILGDPRSQKMQSVMNLKIKYRESFRPFAPAVLEEDVAEYFELNESSPYMLIVAPLASKHQSPMTEEQRKLFGIEKLNVPRSTLPAVTHVDYSARVQTVHKETNPKFYDLLKAFKNRTGCGVLVNTSFNVRGEPIVCSTEDAYRCFMRTEMDYLVVENFLIDKKEQIRPNQDLSWQKEFELD